MLTLFSCPRSFRGHISTIQTNAIHSWTLLRPKPEILLFGDDEGVDEISIKFGARHISGLKRNQYGTPLINSLFYNAQESASHNLICYVNSDIMLMNSIMGAIQKILEQVRQKYFLIIGQRWDVILEHLWDFSSPDWELRLKTYASINGKLDLVTGIDYFIFPKGLWNEIPPFALGRCWHDAWLIYRARALNAMVIDATSQVMVIHQRHNFSYTPFNKKGMLNMKSPEIIENQNLCKNHSRFYTVLDATHIINYDTITKPALSRIIRKYFIWLVRYSWYILAEVCYPYSLPIVILVRGLKK